MVDFGGSQQHWEKMKIMIIPIQLGGIVIDKSNQEKNTKVKESSASEKWWKEKKERKWEMFNRERMNLKLSNPLKRMKKRKSKLSGINSWRCLTDRPRNDNDVTRQ